MIRLAEQHDRLPMRMIRIVFMVGILTLTSARGLPAEGPAATDNPVPASEILSKSAWFDPATEQPRAIPLRSETRDEENRFSRWDPRKNRGKSSAPNPAAPAAGGGGGGWAGISGLGPVASWILAGLLVAVVLSTVLYAFQHQSSDSETDAVAAQRKRPVESLTDQIEKLPVRVALSFSDLLAQAKHAFGSGDYRQAVICAYGHALITLDRHHQIRLTLGKTNRQYVRELGANHPQRPSVIDVVKRFEWVFFGGNRVDASFAQDALRRAEEIQQALQSKGVAS